METNALLSRENVKMVLYQNGLQALYPFLRIGEMKYWGFLVKYTALSILSAFWLSWAWVLLRCADLNRLINQAEINKRPRWEIRTIKYERNCRVGATVGALLFLLNVISGIFDVNLDLTIHSLKIPLTDWIITDFRVPISAVTNFFGQLLLSMVAAIIPYDGFTRGTITFIIASSLVSLFLFGFMVRQCYVRR
jgi:hypothetical protein